MLKIVGESMLYVCVVSVCCVGFASLNVVCDDLHDCTWNPVLFNVYSVITVDCCVFHPCYMGVFAGM